MEVTILRDIFMGFILGSYIVHNRALFVQYVISRLVRLSVLTLWETYLGIIKFCIRLGPSLGQVFF